MSALLGRVALDGKPVCWDTFLDAFHATRTGGCSDGRSLRSIWGGFGYHNTGLGGDEPSLLQQGSLTIVSDAVLHERENLIGALGGLDSKPQSDAHLILLAFRRWGIECLSRLYGDFTFAVHNSATGELWLAADHIGSRPLFWARRGPEVLFASFLQGLVSFQDVPWAISEHRVAAYLCNPHDFRSESFIDGVERVDAGCVVCISREGVVRHRWWSPEAIEISGKWKQEDANDRLRELVRLSVSDRLPGNGLVGAHFSGGIDSTLVAMTASRVLQERASRLRAVYTWCPAPSNAYPDMGPGDERRLVGSQSAAMGVPVRYREESGDVFERLVAEPLELQGTADLIDELSIIDQARADGLGVMLSGWGGDEALSNHGYGHLAWLLWHGHFHTVMKVARRLGGGLSSPYGMASVVWRGAIVPLLPDSLFHRFNPFFDLYVAGAFPSEQMRLRYRELERPERPRLVADAHSYMCSVLVRGHVAERMATWAAWSAPAGFEYRYPLTDRRLLEFILSLPRAVKFGDGGGRWLAPSAFKEILPRGVKKRDPASSKLRHDNWMSWWSQLGSDLRAGRFDVDCPWLDMSALKLTIRRGVPADSTELMRSSACLLIAVRVYEMYLRARTRGMI